MSFRQSPIIRVRYFGPTNHRGARLIANTDSTRITVAWDHALGTTDNYIAAAQALATKKGWQLQRGGFLDDVFFVTADAPEGQACD